MCINIVIKHNINDYLSDIIHIYLRDIETRMNEYTRFSKCHTTNETVYIVGLWSCSVLKWGQYASAYMCDGRERTFSYMTERPMLFDDYLNRLTAYIFDVIAPKEMVEVHTCKATQSALPRCIANRCSNHLISKDTCVITTHPICDCFLFHSIKPHFFLVFQSLTFESSHTLP